MSARSQVSSMNATMICLGILGLGGFLIGCRDLTGAAPLPAGTVNPSVVESTAGAVQTATAAQIAFQNALGQYIPISGELTDELTDVNQYRAIPASGVPSISFYPTVQIDARLLDQGTTWSESNNGLQPLTATLYGSLQVVRGLGQQAIGGLTKYAPDSLRALRGQLYALLGYTDLMLADLFCSGIPLSTLDYDGDYTYQPGSTTDQVYTQALALFDSALTLATDSAAVINLAHIGQARAYLALGQYATAGQAVAAVPTTFQYTESIQICGNATGTACSNNVATRTLPTFWLQVRDFSVSNREGGIGLPFVSSGDPRTADTVVGTMNSSTQSIYFPTKYSFLGISAITLASGLEAQLITAEADLNANNAAAAFTILNALRSNNPQTQGLPPLHDPGTFSAEIDTLMEERAAWLFVDGHRQGDLRRLIRQYVTQQGVTPAVNHYPSGPYPGGVGLYGPFIDAPIPATELANPLWTGCLSRDETN